MVIAAALLLAGAGPSAAALETPVASWLTAEDYPKAAMRAGEEGRVTVELRVDAAGAVAACVVAVSSGSQALDAQTCRLFTQRARFFPARDGRGQPLAAVVRQAVRWELPRVPVTTRLADEGTFVLDRGRIVSCTEPGAGGSATSQADGCEAHAGFLRSIVGTAYDRARRIALVLSQDPGASSPPRPVAGTRFVAYEAVFSLGADGRVAQCRVRTASPDPAIDPCAPAVSTVRYQGKAGDAFVIALTAVVE